MTNKDFPSLPPPQPKSEKKKKPVKVDDMDFLKKPEEGTKNAHPLSFKEADENQFQLKAERSNRPKNIMIEQHNPIQEGDYPALGGGYSAGPIIISERKNELEVKFGIKLNKSKKGRR